MKSAIDLNKELIKHPASTFYERIKGDSMIDANVYEDDILVIDKSRATFYILTRSYSLWLIYGQLQKGLYIL